MADALASHPRAEENLPALRVQETNEKPMGERRPDVLRFVVHFCRSVCDWVLFYVRDERDCERVVGDYVGRVFRLYRCGCAIATAYWFLANRFMTTRTRRGGSKNSDGSSISSNNNVEWLFAFDVHCNSFVPLFVALYLGQLILSPLLSQRGFICALLSNILYGLSLSYYHYCQFVGFNSLPFLERTEFLLYPVVGLVLLAIPLSAMQFNPTRWVLSWYFGAEVLK